MPSSQSSSFPFRREALRAHYEDGDLVFSSEANGLVTRLSFADFSVNGRVLGKIGCRKDINTDCAIHFYDATSEGILGRLSVPQSMTTGLSRALNRSLILCFDRVWHHLLLRYRCSTVPNPSPSP